MTSFRAIVQALKAAGELVGAPEVMPEITGVADDSRRVLPGVLFCAIQGTQEDGHRYVADAQRAGAAAALVTRHLDIDVPQVLVRDSRVAASVAAQTWFGRPADQLTIAAVTGTNGKSTTVALLRHLLNHRETVATIGTLGAFDGHGDLVSGESLTTPGAVELQAILARLTRGGIDTVVMEASSHGITQGRLHGLSLAVAVYTNLTHDHLDYHADFAEYRAAKMQLSDSLDRSGTEVVFADDPAWVDLPTRSGMRRIRYGRSVDADVRAANDELTADGSQFDLMLGDARYTVRLPLLGGFNVMNAVGAAAAAVALGEAPEGVAARLEAAPQVPGRMERLVQEDFTIVRDYAHTPDALDRIIGALRAVTPGRLVVLFGAGGDRDRAKRPVMGRVVAQGADIVYLTSDNPRTEDPERILDDIQAGMSGAHPIRITDRRAAIHQAVRALRKGDCLVLAGKGHETYQVVGHERRVFDEPAIVRAARAERVS